MTNHYNKMFFVDEYMVTRLQTGNWDQETSDEDIEEIGNSGIVETIIDPVVPSTVTLNTNDWGSTDLLAQLMGTEAGVDVGQTDPYDIAAGNRNDWVVDEAQIKLAMVDMLVRVQNDDDLSLESTVWIPNCQVSSINWSYSVDGNATENVTLRGDTDRHFIVNYRQGSVEIGVWASTVTATMRTTADTNITALYYSVNGTIYPAAGYAWATSLFDITGCSGAPTLVDGDRIRVFFVMTTSDDSYTELDTSGIGAIKAPYCVIGLGDATEGPITSGTKTLRLQSVDVNVTVTRQDIKEIGSEALVGSPMQKQEVSVDATVLEEDMENLAKIMGISNTDYGTGDVEFKLQDAIGNANVLWVSIYDDSSQTNLLKQLEITDLTLLNNPFTQDVGALGQYTMNLRGDNWLWTGKGDIGRLNGSYPADYPLNQDTGA